MSITNPLIERLKNYLMAFAIVTLTVITSAADACRDCPFPMKIADGTWLISDGNYELSIREFQAGADQSEIHVTLRESSSRKLVAVGMVKQHFNQRFVELKMTGRNGAKVWGRIIFKDQYHKEISEADFRCDSCAPGKLTSSNPALLSEQPEQQVTETSCPTL
jgi:hypothetical protein